MALGCGVTRADDVGRSVGSYGWGGGFGTYWINDPGEDLVALLMVQQPSPTLWDDFSNLVYQAIDN